MKQIKIIFFLLLTISPGVSVLRAQGIDPYLPDNTTPPVIAGKTLVWNDDFNVDGKPNSSNWKSETGFVRNQELQYYQSANVNCVGGVCVFTGKRDTVLNAKYVSGSSDWRYSQQYAYWTSGSIITQGLKSFQYGQFEIRARIDTTVGSWPAIWQKGVSGSWPNCGETDIMEFYISGGAKTILANVAWGSASAPTVGTWNTKKTALSTFLAKDADWCKKFHVWKERWNKDSLKIYLDDQLLNTQLLANTTNATGISPVNPYFQPHYFILNQAIGVNGGKPRAKTSAYKYEVDYVRVYQDNTTDNNDIKTETIGIYPNPVSEVLNIVSDNKLLNLTIIDMVGNQLVNQNYPAKQVSLSSLRDGIYIARIITADGAVLLKNIIKK